MKTLKQYISLIISLIILLAIIFLAPWHKIIPLVEKITAESLVAMIVLSMVYYAVKAIRFWVMLRILGIKKPLHLVTLVYMGAQPVSVLPAGELYRTILLDKELGVPAKASAATVTLQGLIEAIVLIGVSGVGAFILGSDRIAVAIIGFIVIMLIISLKQGWFTGGERILNKLPFVSVSSKKLNRFLMDHQRLLTGRALVLIGTLSMIPVAAGITIFYIAAHAVGSNISLPQAGIGYSLPVVLSGLSFLPGGIGASEGGTIGILKLIGVGTAASFAITLIIRVFTLGAGMVYGLIAQVILQLRGRKS